MIITVIFTVWQAPCSTSQHVITMSWVYLRVKVYRSWRWSTTNGHIVLTRLAVVPVLYHSRFCIFMRMRKMRRNPVRILISNTVHPSMGHLNSFRRLMNTMSRHYQVGVARHWRPYGISLFTTVQIGGRRCLGHCCVFHPWKFPLWGSFSEIPLIASKIFSIKSPPISEFTTLSIHAMLFWLQFEFRWFRFFEFYVFAREQIWWGREGGRMLLF